MLYRVIARIGYTGDDGTVTTAMRARLLGAGLLNSNTGTFESPAMELSEVNVCFAQVLGDLAELEDHEGPRLKHLWLYIDGPVPFDAATALLGPEEN